MIRPEAEPETYRKIRPRSAVAKFMSKVEAVFGWNFFSLLFAIGCLVLGLVYYLLGYLCGHDDLFHPHHRQLELEVAEANWKISGGFSVIFVIGMLFRSKRR